MHDEELIKIASYYDQIGREFYKASSMDMGNASAAYGVGSKLKGGFMSLVQKIMGKLKGKKPVVPGKESAK